MKKVFSTIGLFSFLLVLASVGFCQTRVSSEEETSEGGIITLYAIDPLATSLCFEDGRVGHVAQYHEIRNRCSDVDFNAYSAGNFTVGVEGSHVGTIIDLGTGEELRQKYGYSESSLMKGTGFVSLHLENQKIVLLKEERKSFQYLKETEQLFEKGKSLATAPVKVGHIYLVRITDEQDKTYERMAKMVVIAYHPNESVTIRWQAISPEQKAATPGN